MQHECKITVIDKKCFTDYQEQYLADPKSGPCPCFNVGDEFILKRTPQQDDFYHLMNGKFCGEVWDAISRYAYTALQGGSIMKGWTNDDRMMIACCNDGTRPVIFKIERIDIPELTETPSDGTEQRTKWNMRDADAILTIIPGGSLPSPGTDVGLAAGETLGKPMLTVSGIKDVPQILSWLNSLPDGIELCVGGPRVSECSEAYDLTIEVLHSIFCHDTW